MQASMQLLVRPLGLRRRFWSALLTWILLGMGGLQVSAVDSLFAGFRNPPPEARPWVYYFIMDGNFSKEGVTADFEAMKQVGIGGIILLEVDVGIPRGPVNFMSEAWRGIFKHAVREAERLGIEITLIAGPGWTGSGGPWVMPEDSMQHLVFSTVTLNGPTNFVGKLPQPQRRKAYFGEDALPADFVRSLDGFYEDLAVLAFPSSDRRAGLPDLDEKALYLRHPYSSMPGVKPFVPTTTGSETLERGGVVARGQIVDVTAQLAKGGDFGWQVPAGRWTVMRMGRVTTGANTRPAPLAGLGLECDKFSRNALAQHFDHYIGSLLREVGNRRSGGAGGWKMLHIDSWEMGAQNWTTCFRQEFRARRGYDPLPYLPVVGGEIVESAEVSERFLWDLRQTSQELVIENHAGYLKELGHKQGFGLSIEPYDMNPCSDLSLGGVADVPMCEFWAVGDGFNTVFSCIEATSIAHTLGRPIVGAEAFTSAGGQSWVRHPATMKAQADWAFCMGINRLVFHRYAHQPWLDRVPGMTMGPYGTQYERTQTWWPYSGPWHRYLARCQYMLRQGQPVADVLYLAAEGAPHVFRPPPSALRGSGVLPDRRGYNFDGCAPETLLKEARVRNGRIVLASGATYQVLVLPESSTMTPALLRKVGNLVEDGATVIGKPPSHSPSLSNYPKCDQEVQQWSHALWGNGGSATGDLARRVGKGKLFVRATTDDAQATRLTPGNLLTNAHWIWQPGGSPAAAAPVGSCLLRRVFELGEVDPIKSARFVATADNSFRVSFNGQPVGEGDNFHKAYEFDVRPLLRRGENVLNVVAGNGGDKPNPAGFVGVLEIVREGGSGVLVASDGKWESANSEAGPWSPALVLGGYGMSPWGKVEAEDGGFPSLYVGYDAVASILRSSGLPPDFESTQPLRYIHRRVGARDLYFLSNPSAESVTAECRFRVVGKKPELWNPLTGDSVREVACRKESRQTVVTVSLDPHGSVFLVFAPGVGKGPASRALQPAEFLTRLEVPGPWNVAFQAGRGAPASLSLDRLMNLSLRPEPGVKYFSGTATYRTSFVLPSGMPDERLFLDLGDVSVVARVRVNGQDLGVVWRAPFRMEIPRKLLVPQNTLEVEVANLWPNRLIGDQSLPPEKRIAFSTFNPFQRDSVLPSSGLLGPVRLQVGKGVVP